MEIGNYDIARLSSDMVKQIQHLENQLKAESGEEITLIAYAKEHGRSRLGECRPGLDD